MKKDNDLFNYRPQHDQYREEDFKEETLMETLDRVYEHWRVVLGAITVALSLAFVVIWAFETYVIVP